MSDLTVERTIPAAPETVFDAWLDPEALARFMTPGPGMTVPRAETDARVGGRFDIVMRAGDKEIPHHGEYREIERATRLVFTWNSPYTTNEQVVTLTLKDVDGETHLTLHHTGFDTEESRTNHEGGWAAILEALETATRKAA